MSPETSDQRFETRAIHEGLGFTGGTGAVISPVFLTSTFAQRNPEGFDYTRSGNPNFRLLERTLASLEGAKYATVFASGVSAITAVVSTLKNGDRILAEENIYGCTFRMFEQVFRKFGVDANYADLAKSDNYDAIANSNPALVWIESPTNPLLKILDIDAIANRCRDNGVPLVVDNTFASSYVQRPIELGADLSLLSTTKYVNGHSDSLGGVVCTNDPEWHDRMVFAQKALGLHPSPFDCWLIARGVKTMALRMERHNANGLAFAQHLESSGAARSVRYPFLKSDPQHDLAKKQMSGGSGIVTAELDLPADRIRRFLDALCLFTLAESLGGIESLICHPASMTHASVPRERREAVGITETLIRFSVGIEHIDDLIADVEQALAVARQ
jgi:cystathionine beta-lyase/cystathionine gamma-synthase